MNDKEFDPNGIDMKTPGAKADSGKLSYSKIPPKALKNIALLYNDDNLDPNLIFVDAIEPLVELIRLFTIGARKYTPCGWMKVPNALVRYYDAMMRHNEADRDDETSDYDIDKIVNEKKEKGTGVLHLTSALWGAYTRLYKKIEEKRAEGKPIVVNPETEEPKIY